MHYSARFVVAVLLVGCGGAGDVPVASTASPHATPPPNVDKPVPATPPAKPPGVRLSVAEQNGTAATNNCPVVVVTAVQGSRVVGEARLQEECEAAPDYNCKDTGEGCATTLHAPGAAVMLGEKSFVWVTSELSWHDGDTQTTDLYGFACGKVAKVWGYTSRDQGMRTSVVLEAAGGDHSKLTAVFKDDEGSRNKLLVWDAARCVYKQQRDR